MINVSNNCILQYYFAAIPESGLSSLYVLQAQYNRRRDKRPTRFVAIPHKSVTVLKGGLINMFIEETFYIVDRPLHYNRSMLRIEHKSYKNKI
ncbi:MAG: hypothetical protein ACLR6J_11520 [Parabacteroides merdae]